MDKFEYKGYWFLPEAENKSIAGILPKPLTNLLFYYLYLSIRVI